MKAIYVIFEDKEFKKLCALKGKITWRRFILKMAKLPYDLVVFAK